MTPDDRTTLPVGPFRVGNSDVVLSTNSSDFQAAARSTFADLAAPTGGARPARTVRFDVVRQPGPTITWGIHRDGEPCELELMDDAVLVHQQWEFNRLAIESQPVAMHSAAVSRGNRAALMLGASHSGKTTLGGWLAVHHDLDYLTDEVAAVDDECRVAPFPRPLGIRSDSPLAALATSRDGATAMPHERLVPASDLGARVAQAPASIDLLVFPTFAVSARTSVTSLDQAAAFERVAALTPGLVAHGSVAFDLLCRIVASAPAIAIAYGDVRDAALIVAATFDEVLAE